MLIVRYFTVLYVKTLITIAQLRINAIKVSIAFLLYILFSLILVFPLCLNLLINPFKNIIPTNWLLFANIIAYILIVSPSITYIFIKKIKQLRENGYYL